MKIQWEISTAIDVLHLHVSEEIPELTYLRQDPEDSDKRKHTTTDAGRALHELEGVVSVTRTNRYSFAIVKGKLFSWNEIKPAILAKVCELLRADPDDVEDITKSTEG